MKVTEITAADCKPFRGAPTQPKTLDPRALTLDPRPSNYNQHLELWYIAGGDCETLHFIHCKSTLNIVGNVHVFFILSFKCF